MSYSLSAEQSAVVNSTSNKILCLAGAGAGKTFCMIARISKLVKDGIDPDSILVLTFTRAAAFEMQERYKSTHANDTAYPEFRTFHGFCYSVLSRNKRVREELGYADIPNIVDDIAIKSIKTTAAMQVGCKLSKAKIADPSLRSPKEEVDFQIYYKAYKRLLLKENVITYDMLCDKVCSLFENNHPSISEYFDKYKYIFVDEFQDTDPAQWRFVKSFINANLFVCGDALQAIYAFRNADSSIIKSLAENPQWTTYKLTYNYRSTQLICDYANKQSVYANPSYRIEMRTSTPGGSVDIYTPTDKSRLDASPFTNEALNYCLDIVNQYPENTAILCRTNNQVEFLHDWLEVNGVHASTNKPNSDALHLLRSLSDSEYAVNWLSALLPSAAYSNYIRDRYILEDYSLDDFRSRFGHFHIVKTKFDLLDECVNMVDELDPDTLATTLLAKLGITCEVDRVFTGSGQVIDYLADRCESDELITGVYIGTIHSVKGLEYDNVIIMGVDGKQFRLSNEENNNLYYVAITRAKTNLRVVIGD